MSDYPIQPLYEDDCGVFRFKENAIVKFLKETSSFDLDMLHKMPFSVEDWEQFMMLLGYSLTGFGELSFVREETYERAEKKVVELEEKI